MTHSTNDKNEDVSEQKIDRTDRRLECDRRCEIRKNYIEGEYCDSIPRRMSGFSKIMLDD